MPRFAESRQVIAVELQGHGAVVDDALGGWGSPATTFPPEVRAAYVRSIREPVHATNRSIRGCRNWPTLPTHPPDELMQRFGSLPLLHQPGEKWLYNSGSDILGVLISRAVGTSLEEFLREQIFAPLGMSDTAFSVPASKLDRLPSSYWTNFETEETEVFDGIDDSRWASPLSSSPAPEAWSRR